MKSTRLLSIILFVALLTWGVFVTLVWFGVPVHGAVLLLGDVQETINSLCEPNAFLCRGVYALWPAIERTLVRVPFLGWYTGISIVLYAAFLGLHAFRTGKFHLQIRLTPLHVSLLGLFSLWLLFMTMSYMQAGDMPIRRIVEPLPSVYQNAGPEALEALQANFDELKSAGCLSLIGHFQNGAEVYDLTTWCMQKAFITRVLPLVMIALVFIFELLVAGRAVLSLFRQRLQDPLLELMVSAGLGAFLWIGLVWLLAITRMLHVWIGWGLVLAVPALGFRHSWYWCKQFVSSAWIVRRPWYGISLLLAWLLISYLALNFLNVVRPFPIGWDDLGSYLNRPRLMVSYGRFVYSMPTFQWEYLSALGFLLFGIEGTFGASVAMIINWTAGLLAVLVTYAFVHVYLRGGAGLLSAFLYYVLPLVGHFSFADMKIDNAVFTMGALGTLAVFLAICPPTGEPHPSEGADPAVQHRRSGAAGMAKFSWLALAGIFLGLAFGMKATAIMVAMGLGAVLLGIELHWVGFIASIFFVFGIFIQRGNLSIADVVDQLGMEPESVSRGAVLAVFFGLGTLLLFLAGFLGRRNLVKTTFTILVFSGAFFISFVPWSTYNNIRSGSSVFHLKFNAPNEFSPLIVYTQTEENAFAEHGQPIRSLPADLVVDGSHPTCSATGAVEELDRYWGYRKGWGHYLTLPWRTVMNVDSAGYYVTTMPALLLVPLLLLLPFFWSSGGRWLRWLFLGTMIMVLQWVFLANGILWYGIGMFLGLVIGLEALVARAPDMPNRVLASLLIGISIITGLGMRFWQFEQQRNLFEYPLGKITATTLRERTIPHYDDIADTVLERHASIPDRPYVYRVGTFIPYFIPKNLEVIGLADHQLDVFNCLHQERKASLTLKRLKALGFNSIVFDTNTATIERDAEGSLHKKVQAFVEFLNSNQADLQLVINDTDAGVAFLLIP